MRGWARRLCQQGSKGCGDGDNSNAAPAFGLEGNDWGLGTCEESSACGLLGDGEKGQGP